MTTANGRLFACCIVCTSVMSLLHMCGCNVKRMAPHCTAAASVQQPLTGSGFLLAISFRHLALKYQGDVVHYTAAAPSSSR